METSYMHSFPGQVHTWHHALGPVGSLLQLVGQLSVAADRVARMTSNPWEMERLGSCVKRRAYHTTVTTQKSLVVSQAARPIDKACETLWLFQLTVVILVFIILITAPLLSLVVNQRHPAALRGATQKHNSCGRVQLASGNRLPNYNSKAPRRLHVLRRSQPACQPAHLTDQDHHLSLPCLGVDSRS